MNDDCTKNMYCNEGSCVGKLRRAWDRPNYSNQIYRYLPVAEFYTINIRIYFLLAKKYTCFDGQCTSSFYGQSVKGSNDTVAKKCAKDPKCIAFQYSSKHRVGLFCSETDARFPSPFEDWKFCSFGSSK